METVSIQLPDDVVARLRNLEQTTGQSGTSHLIEAIRDYLDDFEDLYVAQQRLADVRAGRSKTVALEEVMKRYGMES